MVTGSDHLIVVSARVSDSGNFTCVAENLADVRHSPPAQLTVFGK